MEKWKIEVETGIRIKVKEGKVIDKKSSSRQSGTSIVVTDLFYNVPARRKFLKSESTEKNHILDTFLNIATIEYKVAFKITIDDKVIYTLPSRNSLIERIEDIFKYKKEDK
jgi:DNA mismatch repair protein MutL